MVYTLTVVSILVISATVVNGFELTILHTNDVHARFEQFNKYGSDCGKFDIEDGQCYGGVARRFTKIQEIRNSHGNVLLLDAGDQFMGTMFFSAHRGMATAYFMDLLGYDAMCLGNHEFDLSVEPLATFLDNVTFPVVSCNTDVSKETRLQGKFTNSWTTVIDGETVGVIGYTTAETSSISMPGPTVSFHDEVEAVTAEVKVLQGQGVNKIIALGHAGITVDKQVAAIDGVDIVVGGHSNTFLYNGDIPSNEDAFGPYPLIIPHESDGGEGLVVQDYMWAKYLGYLNIVFDDNGVVTQSNGNPILLDGSVTQDPDILQQIETWKAPIAQEMAKIIGHSNVLLSTEDDICEKEECNFGNMITDAIIDYFANFTHPASQWAPGAIAFSNGGGIRSSIDKGPISMSEVLNAMPFGNEINLLTLKGDHIREQLEHSVSAADWENPHGRFMQMSGMRVVYDIGKPVGKRVTSVEVRCLECDVPIYSPLDDTKEYKIFMSNFISYGGDGYDFKPSNFEPFNTLDMLPLTSYITRYSPMYAGVEGRIRYVNQQTSDGRMNSVTCLTVLTPIILSILSCITSIF